MLVDLEGQRLQDVVPRVQVEVIDVQALTEALPACNENSEPVLMLRTAKRSFEAHICFRRSWRRSGALPP